MEHGEGNGNPLQYSCLENPMDRGAWQATVQEVTESDTIEQLTTTNTTNYYFHCLLIEAPKIFENIVIRR